METVADWRSKSNAALKPRLRVEMPLFVNLPDNYVVLSTILPTALRFFKSFNACAAASNA